MSGKDSLGTVCTFYSFKGGVGRSMALANVAALLARWGQRVLVIDWDLEAPGIEKFFQRWLRSDRRGCDGLVELVRSSTSGTLLKWRDCTLSVGIPQAQPFAILHAGRDDPGYVDRLRTIDWENLFEKHRFGIVLESLRNEWVREFDFVLIDSRTGITDIGGICSIFLPDFLLTFFTANEQSLVGVRDVMTRAREGHERLPVDRRRLLLVPIPSRDESNSEYKLASEWRKRFASELEAFFKDWIPKDETAERVLNHLKIPYFPFWSFGERLPVLEEDPDNPKTLAFSYQLIARLLIGKLDWQEVREGTRAAGAEAAQQMQVQEKRREVELVRATVQREAEERRRAEERERAREQEARLARFVAERLEPFLTKNERWQFQLWVGVIVCAGFGVAFLGTGVAVLLEPGIVYRRDLSFSTSILLTLGPALLLLLGGYRTLSVRRRSVLVRGQILAEKALFDGQAGPYSHMNSDAAFRRFVERVERAISLRGLPDPRPEPGMPDWVAAPSSGTPSEAPVLRGGAGAPGADDAVVTEGASEPVLASPSLERTTESEPLTACDIYLSYRKSRVVDGWLAEFLPLLRAWTEETLGRKAHIFYDKTLPDERSDWQSHVSGALSHALCFLAVVTPAYFASEQHLQEWRAFESRAPNSIVPVILHGGEFPELGRQVQWLDFSDFAYLGEGFSRSDRYVEFQDRVKQLAATIAEKISAGQRDAAGPA